MAQSRPLNGEETPRRCLTTYSEYLAQKNITEDLPAAERIARIAGLCRIFEMGANHLSENFQPGELEKRIGKHDGVPSSSDEMVRMFTEDEHVVDLIECCIKDMARFEESKVNGAALEFQVCSQILFEQKARLEAGRKALAGLLHADPVAGANDHKTFPDWCPVVACAALNMATFFLAVEEMIAA
jgi:hypothetical protein